MVSSNIPHFINYDNTIVDEFANINQLLDSLFSVPNIFVFMCIPFFMVIPNCVCDKFLQEVGDNSCVHLINVLQKAFDPPVEYPR